MPKPILKEREPDVTSAGEDDGTREPDLETVQVEAVDVRAPAEDEVVEDREGRGGGEAVCECARERGGAEGKRE